MRIILSILFGLFSLVGMAQVFQTNSAPYYYPKGLKTGLLIGPKGCGAPASISNPIYGQSSGGALYSDTCNGKLYQFTGVSWVLINGSTVTPSALTKLDDTNVTLDFSGNNTIALLEPVQLRMGWTGTLADSRITSAAKWNAYNLDSVVSRGNWTDDSLNIQFSGTNVASIYRDGGGAQWIGNILLKSNYNNKSVKINNSDFLFNNNSNIKTYLDQSLFALNNNSINTLADTTGTLTVGVKANGTTYMAGQNGIADLGTIGGGVAGSNTQIQFNNSGAFGASSNLTWDNANARLFVGSTTTSFADPIVVVGRDANTETSLMVGNSTNGTTGYPALRLMGTGTSAALMALIPSAHTGIYTDFKPTAVIDANSGGGALHLISANSYISLVTNGRAAANRVLTATNAGNVLIGVGTTTNPSAKLQIDATTQGFLMPRGTSAQRTGISTPAAGLMFVDNDSTRPFFYTGSAWKGLRFTDEGGGSSPTDYHQSIVSINDSTVKFTKPNGNADTLTVTTYALTANAINYSATGTNADITAVSGTAYYLPPATLSQNRTFTMPTGSELDVIEIYNLEAGYLWLMGGEPVYLGDGITALTFLAPQTPYLFRKIGNKWRIRN